jgi:hypothetical protein
VVIVFNFNLCYARTRACAKTSITIEWSNLVAYSTLTFNDYSNEKSTVSVFGETRDAANFAGQATEASALSVAIAALSIGTLVKRTVSDVILDAAGTPTDAFAQRELKWRVTYIGDTSGKEYQIEIPCADLDGNLVPGTDLADLTATPWANFITAFEAYGRTPDSPTETVTVVSARVVGRNL